MIRYNLTYLTVQPTAVGKALAGLDRFLQDQPLRGRFLACWSSEIGQLGRIVLLHGYEKIADVPADRESLLYGADPFGIAEHLVGMDTDAYAPLEGLAPIVPGKMGPFFEIRSYGLKPGGLTPTLEAWRKAVPPRSEVSPLLMCMYAVGGQVPRIVHIWPYESLDARLALRNEAVARGVWPPAGAPPHLASMQSEIFMPAPFSPIG